MFNKITNFFSNKRLRMNESLLSSNSEMSNYYKGLRNNPGENNCFLNSAIQVNADLNVYLLLIKNKIKTILKGIMAIKFISYKF